MNPFKKINATTFVLPQTDIDTDQIIPARFLTTTDRAGLGRHAFADWRYDDAGNPIDDAPLNSTLARNAEILVAGNNFGCGSSREHAPWALLDFGFRVVISTEFGDIFRSNSLKNGLLPLTVNTSVHAWLTGNPGSELTVDLESCTVTFADGQEIEFSIDEFARYCLLEGIDQLGFLLGNSRLIDDYERANP